MTAAAFQTLVGSVGLPWAAAIALAGAYLWKDKNSVPLHVYQQECERGNKLADAYSKLAEGVRLLLDRTEGL
jgi:hypothetical protein